MKTGDVYDAVAGFLPEEEVQSLLPYEGIRIDCIVSYGRMAMWKPSGWRYFSLRRP